MIRSLSWLLVLIIFCTLLMFAGGVLLGGAVTGDVGTALRFGVGAAAFVPVAALCFQGVVTLEVIKAVRGRALVEVSPVNDDGGVVGYIEQPSSLVTVRNSSSVPVVKYLCPDVRADDFGAFVDFVCESGEVSRRKCRNLKLPSGLPMSDERHSKFVALLEQAQFLNGRDYRSAGVLVERNRATIKAHFSLA